MTQRLKIGFLINDIVGAYQFNLWNGIDAACSDKNIDLFVFTGGEVGSTDPTKYARGTVFGFANPANIDGLIISAPAVGNYMSQNQIVEYCHSFAPLPVVTLSLELPKLPSVTVDNAAGVEVMVEHLVVKHLRKKIAFIGGPAANNEAQARLNAYRNVLKRHNLGPFPHLELIANFDHEIAYHGAIKLLSDNPDIDAIVAANDDMALGVLEALKELGIKIPDRVAVCGFDDIEETQYSTPSLSTVRQPLFDQGFGGVELLLDLMNGKHVPDEPVVIPATPVMRQSCGCEADEMQDITIPPGTTMDGVKTIFRKQMSAAVTVLQKEIYRNVLMQRKIRDFQILSERLINTFDTALLVRTLSTELKRQAIVTSYLVLDTIESAKCPGLMMAVEENTILTIPAEGIPLQKGRLLPDGFGNAASRRTLIVEPLFFNASPLGYFMYSLPPSKGVIHEALRTTISAALQAALLVEQVKKCTVEIDRLKGELHENG